MQAADIMTPDVITVRPDTTVREIAERLLANRISAVPVVDAEGKLRGIVSEGDLIRRAETDTDTRRTWWLELVASAEERAAQYVKEHGRKADEVMTRNVITVVPQATLREIADLLERHHIKRLPVVDGGRLVGIVSRANILRGLATAPELATGVTVDDRQLRHDVMAAIAKEAGVGMPTVDVVVHDGNVQLWGLVDSDSREQATVVAAENVPGVRSVESRIGRTPRTHFGI